MDVSLAQYIAPGGHAAPEAYQEVARHLLAWSDAFLFAWNGQPPQGVGGTGETVMDACEMGIPSRVINAENLEPRWSVPHEMGSKARHGFETRRELLEHLDQRFYG
ncbi:MAG: hypothetical protein H7Y36_04870 [Armatimonadetes bacterium]|nr:hypothetical protein [Akkermansiaceae bacterium]